MALTHLRMFAAYLLVVLSLQVHAQDTAFVYDIANGVESFIVLPAYDTTVVADSLPPHYGNYGVTAMPTAKPGDTLPFSGVSKPFVVTDSFPNFNFPFTAITSARYGHHITAAVIGPHSLLVFNYDVYNANAQDWRNPYPIKPFFNNGAIQFGYGQLTPVRYYCLSPLKGSDNMAIIEVQENIGNNAGYFGIAYDTSLQAFSDDRMLYNISYPSQSGPFIQTPYNDSVNGDTMYMRYGNPQSYLPPVYINFQAGGEGDYVSPLFDEDYQIRAIRWSAGAFTPIAPRSFNFLKYVLQNLATNVEEVEEDKEGFNIYPNPTNGNFMISGKGVFNVYDVSGKLLLTGQENKQFHVSTSGLYLVKNTANGVVQKLVVTE